MNGLLEMLLEEDEHTDTNLAAVCLHEKIYFNKLAKELKGLTSRQTISVKLKKLVEYNVLTCENVQSTRGPMRKQYGFSEEFKEQKDYEELSKRYLNKSY